MASFYVILLQALLAEMKRNTLGEDDKTLCRSILLNVEDRIKAGDSQFGRYQNLQMRARDLGL